MKSRKVIPLLLAVVIILLTLGIFAWLRIIRQPQSIEEGEAAATSVYISPNSITKSPGETVEFAVVMKTNKNKVIGVDIDLNYDPEVIEIQSVSQGSGIFAFDQEIRNNIDNSAGKINYSAFTLNTSNSVGGVLNVLDITGVVKSTAYPGDYSISFEKTTAAAAVGERQNVIDLISGMSVQIVAK
jgi:hypothetical protein